MAPETALRNGSPLVSTMPSSDNGRTNPADPPHEGDHAEVIGAFKDDPMLDAMVKNIYRRRREVDADDAIE